MSEWLRMCDNECNKEWVIKSVWEKSVRWSVWGEVCMWGEVCEENCVW